MHFLNDFSPALHILLILPLCPLVSARPQVNAPLPDYQPEYSVPVNANLTELKEHGFFYACATYNPANEPLEKQICFEAWRSWLSSHMAKTYILTPDPSRIPPQPHPPPQWVVIPSDSDFVSCKVRVNAWPIAPPQTTDRSIAQNTMLEGLNSVWMNCFGEDEERGKRYDGGYVVFDNEGRGQVVMSVSHLNFSELTQETVEKGLRTWENGTEIGQEGGEEGQERIVGPGDAVGVSPQRK